VYARIAPKSSLALEGYDVSAGVVDKGYRGELKVVLVNNGKNFRHFRRGDKIAQLIFEVAEVARFEAAELTPTERGAGGFGSTGK
jgi:dUTP pyrophosphatase